MTDKYQTREERRQKQSSASQKKGKKNAKGFVKKTFLAFVALGIIGMIAGAATFAFMVKDAPKLDEKLLKDPISSEILDMNKEPITEIGSVRRDYVDYENIPKIVENAFIAVEDARFYDHNGIDLIRLGGAVIANVTEGFGSEGASTITQQVVKNSFLSPEKTISRKAQEAWLSFQLERKYTKQEIFEMYVNKIWMASGGHGVATAAKIYYGKELNELTLAEAALLAGMPQSPANFDPFNNPEKAEKRRNIVLLLMHKHGFITQEELDEAKSVDVTSTLVKEEERRNGEIPYDSFIGQVIKEINKKYPELDPFSDGLKIYTTLDQNAQQHVDKMLSGNDIVQFPDDKFQAGITLLDTKTGEIRAIGGGRNKKVTFGFNYATDAKRQPGSTIKPILDYGPAVEYLKWGTYHVLDDKPYTYTTGQPINNWDNKHMGPMSMRTALALSRNVPALQAMQAVGLDQAKAFANGIGIPLKDIQEAYSIGGLGGPDTGVSSLEMAGAYSAFGNNGFYTEPYSVIEIELRDGTKLDMKPETKVAMQDYTAFMVSDMLKSVLDYGTGTRAKVPGLTIAGKTGTTNYPEDVRRANNIPQGAVPDSWFVGYTTDYTAAVWTGYPNQNENYLIGEEQRISQYLFKNLMEHVSQGKDTPGFTMPNSVEKVQIEKGSVPAKLASEFTPSDQIIYEYAVKGHAPKEVSEKFEKLDIPSNFKAELDEEKNEIVLTWDYEGGEGVQFEVSGSLNEGAEQPLKTLTEKSLRVKADFGGFYSFKVIAVRGELQSDPASVTIEVPDPFNLDEEIIEEEEEVDEGTGEGDDGQNEDGEGDGSSDDEEDDEDNGDGDVDDETGDGSDG